MGVAQPSICAGHSILCPYEFTQGARVRNAVHLAPEIKMSKRVPARTLPARLPTEGESPSPAATSSDRLALTQFYFTRGGYDVSRLSQSERILDKPHPAAYKLTAASANEYYVLIALERSATRPDCFSFGDWAAYSSH